MGFYEISDIGDFGGERYFTAEQDADWLAAGGGTRGRTMQVLPTDSYRGFCRMPDGSDGVYTGRSMCRELHNQHWQDGVLVDNPPIVIVPNQFQPVTQPPAASDPPDTRRRARGPGSTSSSTDATKAPAAKSRKGLWIALGITAVVVVGGVTTAVVVSKKKRGKRRR